MTAEGAWPPCQPSGNLWEWLLQEHTPDLHLLATAPEQEQALGFPAADRHCNRGATAFWGKPTRVTHSERLRICYCASKPTTSFLAFPRSHLSTILASRCSAFFLKLLQWQLSIQLGNKEIIPLGKPKCFRFLKIQTFPPRLAASEVLDGEITGVINREWGFPYLSGKVPRLKKTTGFLKHT